MREDTGVPLSGFTTLRLGGPAARVVTAASDDEIVAAATGADQRGEAVLLLAGGSNLVISDAGFDGTVVLIRSRGVSSSATGDPPDGPDGRALRTVAAGEPWDEFVARCVAEDLAGVEALSGIPGVVGSTPIQNVGAYGQEVSETIVSVRAYDRDRRDVVLLDASECAFTYRHSIFKGSSRWIVLAVTFALYRGGRSRPVKYSELARRLGVQVGGQAPLPEVREAVLALRRGKGMVLDPHDPDTNSVGSFFTNPILGEDEHREFVDRVHADLGPDVRPPAYPAPDDRVKTSAAWLIERAGFPKGYGHGHVSISTKHTLALTNRGGATTAELLDLAYEVRNGVLAAFGVELVPEPVFVGQVWERSARPDAEVASSSEGESPD